MALGAVALGLGLALLVPSGATAASGCTKVASPAGSDSAPGSEAQPYRTAQKLVDSLTAGQVGCLRAGTFASQNEVKVTRAGITLRSYPGERATLRTRLWIAQGADDVTFTELELDGRNETDLPSPTVNAHRATFSDNEITNHNTAICFDVGSGHGWGRSDGTVIEQNRIHHCGRLPATNHDHGIYVEAADGTVIRDNVIYDNADRGIQLYPDADNTRITGNVIDGNGQGVIFSGEDGAVSSNNLVAHNVISNSRVRWNVESAYPDNHAIGEGNVVRDNCLWATNPDDYYNSGGGVAEQLGFSALSNIVADPEFVDREAKDFALREGSPCADVQAGGKASPVLTLVANRKKVKKGRKLKLRGEASSDIDTVELLLLKRDRARTVAHVTASGNGFAAKVKARPAGKVRFLAAAPGEAESNEVKVKIKRR